MFGTGITLAPGDSFSGQGRRTACPRCRHIVDVPDGEYGVVDGAVRWLRQFKSAEQRAHLVEVLHQAHEQLRSGAAPEAVADEIESATGLRVWDFLLGAKSSALAAWIAAILALVTYLGQNDVPATTPVPPPTDVTVVVNNVLPQLSPAPGAPTSRPETGAPVADDAGLP